MNGGILSLTQDRVGVDRRGSKPNGGAVVLNSVQTFAGNMSTTEEWDATDIRNFHDDLVSLHGPVERTSDHGADPSADPGEGVRQLVTLTERRRREYTPSLRGAVHGIQRLRGY